MPRSKLGFWSGDLRRMAPAELLAHASDDRLSALAPIKHERMAASAFGFFRGAAPVMAYDLSLTPHTGILTQLCGDAHVQNLGAYTGPDGRLIFDINDFDETIRGPFEWDVKRMSASILLAARETRIRSGHRADAGAAAEVFLLSYCSLMEQLARMPVLAVARFLVHGMKGIAPISKILGRAERSTPQHSLDTLTEQHRGGRRFKSAPPLLRRVTGAEARQVLASLELYAATLLPERRHFLAQFQAFDVAFKVVGTGSVGLRDYCVYMQGNGEKDPLFLQIKQESASAYAPYLPPDASRAVHEGQRVAEGQRAMQLQSDPLLGWTTIEGRGYLVRQLNDHKASVDMTQLSAAGLAEYAQVCGELLARGHARAGDARTIAGYLGGGGRFRQAMLTFAESYAAQTVEDWKALVSSKS